MARVKARKGMPKTELGKDEFEHRLRQRFYDPAFSPVDASVEATLPISGKPTRMTERRPGRVAPAEALPTPTMKFPSNGLRRELPLPRRNVSRSRVDPCHASCSSTVRRGATRPALAKFRRPGGWSSSWSGSSGGSPASTSNYWTSAESYLNAACTFIPARPAFRPPCRSATGPAPATPIMPMRRSTTG